MIRLRKTKPFGQMSRRRQRDAWIGVGMGNRGNRGQTTISALRGNRGLFPICLAVHHADCASAGVRFFGAFGRLNAIWGDSPAIIAMSISASRENK